MLHILDDPDNVFPYKVYCFDFALNEIIIASANGVFRIQFLNGSINLKNLQKKVCNDIIKHVATGTIHTIFLKGDGSILGFGNNGNCQLNSRYYGEIHPVQIQLPARAIHVACGQDMTIVVFENGFCKFGDTFEQITPAILLFTNEK